MLPYEIGIFAASKSQYDIMHNVLRFEIGNFTCSFLEYTLDSALNLRSLFALQLRFEKDICHFRSRFVKKKNRNNLVSFIYKQYVTSSIRKKEKNVSLEVDGVYLTLTPSFSTNGSFQ